MRFSIATRSRPRVTRGSGGVDSRTADVSLALRSQSVAARKIRRYGRRSSGSDSVRGNARAVGSQQARMGMADRSEGERPSRSGVGLSSSSCRAITSRGCCSQHTGCRALQVGTLGRSCRCADASIRLQRGSAGPFDLYPLSVCHLRLGSLKLAASELIRGLWWHITHDAGMSQRNRSDLRMFIREALNHWVSCLRKS